MFSITKGGELTSLYSFDGADDFFPNAALVQGTDGNFYGTTTYGGAGTGNLCFPQGCGTVFKITPSGVLITLHSFNGIDGAYCYAGLVQGKDGSFYGTTEKGGSGGSGTVFRITPNGLLTTLQNFCFRCQGGVYPYAGLVLSSDGNFYGTTAGGANARGTVFKITPSGKLAVLHTFCQMQHCTDGKFPVGVLVQGTDGMFYGTTNSGGANTAGTVFRLSLGLGPFVETNPAAGEVGAVVRILGTNLTGATSVTFNGAAATFTVKSKSEITTAVPTGATTGTVQVVTPGGTLSSNVLFQVTP